MLLVPLAIMLEIYCPKLSIFHAADLFIEEWKQNANALIILKVSLTIASPLWGFLSSYGLRL